VLVATIEAHRLSKQATRNADADARAHPARPHAANSGSANAK